MLEGRRMGRGTPHDGILHGKVYLVLRWMRYEDYDRDKKKNCYNPLTFVQEEQAQDLDTWCRFLTSMMSECAKSFERLPILLHADILRNILYSGVWSKYEYLQIKKRRIEEKAKKKEHKQ